MIEKLYLKVLRNLIIMEVTNQNNEELVIHFVLYCGKDVNVKANQI